MTVTPLKYVARANILALSQGTDPEFQFLYCDVSSVERGKLSIPETEIAFADAPSRARRIASSGDVVMSTVRPYLKAVAQVPEETDNLVFSTGFAVLSPKPDEITSRYLYWAMQSDTFVAEATRWSNGVSYPAVNVDDLMRIKLPIPPHASQERLSTFLDRETVKIDHLIAKQRELLNLLTRRQELYRDTLFDRYVGVGERLKWNLVETNTRLGDNDPNELPLLSVSIHWGVSPRAESVGEASSAASFEKYKTVAPGDIILNRMRAFQGAVGYSCQKGFTSPDYAVFEPTDELEPSWLMQVMKSQKFVAEMKRRLTGIGGTEGGKVRTPRINSGDLLDIQIHIPSQSSQQRDMHKFQREQQRVAKIKKSVKRHIKLAMERRSALITAAVTGQIEV